MPHDVPKEQCFRLLFDALRAAGVLRLSGDALLLRLNHLAGQNWPVPVYDLCPDLKGKPHLAALALTLPLLWPPGMWNTAEAVHEFRNLAADLQPVWDTGSLTDEDRLRKTVDHAIVSGIRRGWEPAKGVLTSMLLGDIDKYQGPVGACIGYLRGYPIPAKLKGAEDKELHFDGLIPDLDRCWGEDFRLDAYSDVARLLNKLLQPAVPWQFRKGRQAEFRWVDGDCEGVCVLPYSREPVLPGSRRNYRLADGNAELLKNGAHFAFVATGQRLILRVFDDGEAELQVAQSRGGSVGGRKLEFGRADDVRMSFCDDQLSILEAWNCTCGALACDEQHRLPAWDPGKMSEKMTLASFLATAVKGPARELHIKVFIQGMYYALLCDGD